MFLLDPILLQQGAFLYKGTSDLVAHMGLSTRRTMLDDSTIVLLMAKTLMLNVKNFHKL